MARRLARPGVPEVALALLMAAVAVLVWRQGSGTTFWLDEWQWIADRRSGGAASYLDAHNGHLSVLPVAVDKLLWTTVGLDDYRPYRALALAGWLGVVAEVFVYARRRIGGLGALGAATAILCLGAGWQDALWGVQLGYLLSLGAGIGALLALDRRDRRGDLLACGLVTIAIASSGVGLVMALAVAIDLAWSRRGSWWVLGIPAVPYALWYLAYGGSTATLDGALVTPPFAADMGAGVVAALAGFPNVADETLEAAALSWGRVLAVVAVAALVWRLRSAPVVAPVRLAALLGAPVAFWVLTGVTRAGLSRPAESRYLHVGAVLLVLAAVEVLRGLRIPRAGVVGLGALVALTAFSNLQGFRNGGTLLRARADETRAALGAVDLADGGAPAGLVIDGFELSHLRVGAYRAIRADLGTPALSPAGLATAPEPGRLVADRQLLHAGQLRVAPSAAGGSGPPTVLRADGGAVAAERGCLRFAAARIALASQEPAIEVALVGPGVQVEAAGAAVELAARRYAASPQPLARVGDGTNAAVTARADGDAGHPWALRLATAGAVRVCAGAGG